MRAVQRVWCAAPRPRPVSPSFEHSSRTLMIDLCCATLQNPRAECPFFPRPASRMWKSRHLVQILGYSADRVTRCGGHPMPGGDASTEALFSYELRGAGFHWIIRCVRSARLSTGRWWICRWTLPSCRAPLASCSKLARGGIFGARDGHASIKFSRAISANEGMRRAADTTVPEGSKPASDRPFRPTVCGPEQHARTR